MMSATTGLNAEPINPGIKPSETHKTKLRIELSNRFFSIKLNCLTRLEMSQTIELWQHAVIIRCDPTKRHLRDEASFVIEQVKKEWKRRKKRKVREIDTHCAEILELRDQEYRALNHAIQYRNTKLADRLLKNTLIDEKEMKVTKMSIARRNALANWLVACGPFLWDAGVRKLSIKEDWSGPNSPKDLFDPEFKWPSTLADGGSGKLTGNGWYPNGVLSLMGYRVGRQGSPARIRQAILSEILYGPIPPVMSDVQMAEWREPRSMARLKKMAETIAALARNAKRKKRHLMDEAVADWEEDLAFLYKCYYKKRSKFSWPTTSI